MLKQKIILWVCLCMAYTCMADAAPDDWSIHIEEEKSSPVLTHSSQKLQAVHHTSLSLKTAAQLLDYRQYKHVIDAMHTRLQDDAKDTAAWQLLIRALEADGQTDKAQQAKKKLHVLGNDHPWNIMIQLATFVDSNVVLAPTTILLPAQDQGDIGASASFMLSGNIMNFEHATTSVWFRYDDMLYQDLNNFAIRNIKGGLMHHFHLPEKRDAWLAILSDISTLNNNTFYSGFSVSTGLMSPLNANWQAKLQLTGGHRTFANAFSAFSAWRWQVNSSLEHVTEQWHTGLKLHISNENTQQAEEAYRDTRLQLHADYKLATWVQDELWLLVLASVNRLDYHNIDRRSFLITPLQRQDDMLSTKLSVEWRKKQSLWGANALEKWYIFAGWSETQSNMNQNTVINPIQSRVWNRWWTELGVTWNY